jgi:hypothetical protein
MALTARERKIMIFAVGAVLILLLNHYAITPIMDKRDQARQDREEKTAQVNKAESALNRKGVIQERWNQMREAGLGSDIQKAEAMVYRFLEDSASRSGLVSGAIQPDRRQSEGQIGQIDFVMSGTGSMQAVTRFLWSLEMAQIPLKIKSYQLGSKDESAREMTIQVELSTIYLKEDDSDAQS